MVDFWRAYKYDNRFEGSIRKEDGINLNLLWCLSAQWRQQVTLLSAFFEDQTVW
jgi:hypothetical protein